MLTASPSTQDHARDIARALSQPGIKIMAVRIVGEADAEDAISNVALRLLERARAGKLKPAKLAAYANRAVQRECFDLYNRQRRAAIDIDDVVLEAAPERVEAQVSIAYHKIDQRFAEQLRLTYHAEIATRDRSGRGVPLGTAVRRTMIGKERLAQLEETHEAAHALGIGRVKFDAVDADAWARECSSLSRTCSGLQTLELIEIWTSLALRRELDLEAVEDWAMRIVGATTEQMDVAEYLIREHWAPLRASADVRGAA